MPIEYQMLTTLTVAAFILLGCALYLRRKYNNGPENDELDSGAPSLRVVLEPSGAAANHTNLDPFVMKPGDHQFVQDLRRQIARDGAALNETEILRAGLHALASLSAQERVRIVEGMQDEKPY